MKQNRYLQSGFSLMEVVIAIAVFTIGILALASLQGSLTRSMTESKMRTQASNLANDTIERLRSFTTLQSTAGVFDYQDIATDQTAVVINGVTYTVGLTVTDYYYHIDTDSFTTTDNGGVFSDYKSIEVVVGWDAVQSIRTSEGVDLAATDLTSADVTIGTDADGNAQRVTGIKVTAVIPALVTSASARVASESGGDPLPTPGVSYTPGANPDVIKLSLGQQKFKESLLPQPLVIRSDKIETTFDVITWASTANGDEFLRREEFTAVSCDCEFPDPSTGEGRRPVVWAGDEYRGGEFVSKPIGVEATGAQQSTLCETCCRDHHDGGPLPDGSSDTYANVYGPFKGNAEYTGGARTSDHLHYQADGITLAGAGDEYEEVCRLVRVDGFFRVAQDFRREDQYVFPDNFLDQDSEVEDYSDYVTNAVAHLGASPPDSYFDSDKMVDGYPSDPPCIGLEDNADGETLTPCIAKPTMQAAPPVAIASGELPSWTNLRAIVKPEQQLQARGVYIDYISNDLRSYLATCITGALDGSGTIDDNCTVGDVELDRTSSTNLLEILPFFDVQLTFLNDWNANPVSSVITVTSEPLSDFNSHSRGEIDQVTLGSAIVHAVGHRGNTGFTDTPPIDPVHSSYLGQANLQVCSLDASGLGGCGIVSGSGDPVISGTFSEDVNPNPPDYGFEGLGDALCYPNGTGWSCEVPAASSDAQIRVFGYGRAGRTRYACSTTLAIVAGSVNTSELLVETTFDLVGVNGAISHNILIDDVPCSP